ncbi:MAG: hypothetical protein MHM6MM_001027 [Cercozoa sp. M6MM]
MEASQVRQCLDDFANGVLRKTRALAAAARFDFDGVCIASVHEFFVHKDSTDTAALSQANLADIDDYNSSESTFAHAVTHAARVGHSFRLSCDVLLQKNTSPMLLPVSIRFVLCRFSNPPVARFSFNAEAAAWMKAPATSKTNETRFETSDDESSDESDLVSLELNDEEETGENELETGEMTLCAARRWTNNWHSMFRRGFAQLLEQIAQSLSHASLHLNARAQAWKRHFH